MFSRILKFIFVSLISMQCAHASYASIKDFIQDQKMIRVITDGADGFGNQTASYNLIIRLRQMGYEGEFEFIYPQIARNKIFTLFDLPPTADKNYYDATAKIRFIQLGAYATDLTQHRVTPITLSLSGVHEGNVCESAQQEGADVSGLNSLTCQNFANFMQSQYFIMFSPFILPKEANPEASKFDNKIYQQNQSEPDYQVGSDSKFIVMPVAQLTDTKKYLKQDARGQRLAEEKPALMRFIEGMENHTFNVLPVYGYPIKNLQRCDESDANCLFDGLSNILQIIVSARHAQVNGPAAFKRPLIIPVFYDYAKEIKGLLPLIQNKLWSAITYPDTAKAQQWIQQLHLSTHFSATTLDAPDAQQRIQQLQPGDILLLSMGPLPKVVFDGLYTHTDENIWPQIREGANSFNSLILTGKPHIRCGMAGDGWELGMNEIKNETFKNWFSHFYNNPYALCGYLHNSWHDETTTIQISDYFTTAHDAGSALSTYFSELKIAALQPENDRIVMGLEAVANQIIKQA